LQIELDAAIFDDGSLIGPDEQNVVAENFGEYVRVTQDWYQGVIDALHAGRSVEEAFSAIEQFLAEIVRHLRSGRPPGRENPLERWKHQAAADVARWRRKYPEPEIPKLLDQHIRLEPFVIHRRQAK